MVGSPLVSLRDTSPEELYSGSVNMTLINGFESATGFTIHRLLSDRLWYFTETL